MTEGYTDHYFDTRGCRLHYVEAGVGPLIIFYHGFPSFWFSFHHQMAALKDRFRVVAVDGPGVNLSSKPTDISLYKLKNLVLQIDDLARHLAEDKPFYLVGHDWGAALAWSFAQHLPSRLHKVVAINAPPTNQLLALLESNSEQQRRSHYMWAMRSGATHQAMTANNGEKVWEQAYAPFRGRPHYTPEHDTIFRAGLGQAGAIDGAINWYRANIPERGNVDQSDYWPSRHASTEVPALLIWGENDQTFVPEFIDNLGHYATNLTIRRLTNVGHTPMLEDPEQTNLILTEFLTL